MHYYSLSENLQSFIENQKSSGKKIAFVPTMGALHEGHLSLIRLGIQQSSVVVCSIFVNPTQFNHPNDLQTYPRMLEADARLLEKTGCHVLFVPDVIEVYPPALDTHIQLDLGTLGQVMEGKFRPGHFDGMLQVVKRLLDLVNPDLLIMGQKDFQQFTLVQHMINALALPVQLVIGPTLREEDGLAMSSRNLRLTPELRKKARILFQVLGEIQAKLGQTDLDILRQTGLRQISDQGLKPEYLEIVDGNTLEPILDEKTHNYLVACLAAWADDVRLIDNIILKGSKD